MTTTLHPAPVPTSQFHYDADTRQYIGEISSTHGFGRVYDDACDEGLTLVGRSGLAVLYVVSQTEIRDGEIVGWVLVPVDAPAHVADVRLHLFND